MAVLCPILLKQKFASAAKDMQEVRLTALSFMLTLPRMCDVTVKTIHNIEISTVYKMS